MGTESEEHVDGLDGIKCSSCLVLCVSLLVILVSKIRQTKNEKTTLRKKITKEMRGEGGRRVWVRSKRTLRCRFRPWMTLQRQDELPW